MYKGATIGCDTEGAPVIGDLAYIGLNAVIVGKVTIGDDVLCAANSFINFVFRITLLYWEILVVSTQRKTQQLDIC